MKSRIYWSSLWIGILAIMAFSESVALAVESIHAPAITHRLRSSQMVVADPPPPVDGVDPQAKPPVTDGRLPERPLIFTGVEGVDVSAPSALAIDIWYGDAQRFGHLGNPQPWVNILGNVGGPFTVVSSTYALNGGAEQPLGIGPDGFRLVRAGDFNVEIDYADLNGGVNEVVIRATDAVATTISKTVTFEYDQGNIWPANHVADWTSSDIQDEAQVVDGKWALEDGVARPLEFGYDRLLAIGDLVWPDYELEVPITVHALDPTGYCGINNGPGVGVALRWQGHYLTDDDQTNNRQPRTGWSDLGALGWYHWGHNGDCVSGGLETLQYMGLGYSIGPGNDSSKQMEFGVEYIFKLSVESSPNPSYYRLKFWKASDPEPAAWNLEGTGEFDGPTAGSALLVAHWVDATFGQVTVTPLNTVTYALTTNVAGDGTITRTPEKSIYLANESVQLTATSGVGWAFKEWQGDVPANSTDASLALTMTDNKEVTAIFEERPEYALAVNVTGQGNVDKLPALASYTENMTVTLTATPDEGWLFKSWSGDIPTVVVSPVLTLTMDSDKVISALFEEAPPTEYSLAIDVTGQGSVDKTPEQSSYTAGMTVTLTAAPDEGWLFKSWGGDVPTATVGASPVMTLTMDGDKAVTALFEEKPPEYTLSTEITGQGSVSKTPDQVSYTEDMTVTLVATPVEGWLFKEWQGDILGVITAPELALTMDREKQVVAIFEEEIIFVFLPFAKR